ncbi:hypothetical protein [Methanomassiliicoccus luminyensis]|uniref:hypothetical protein n=1 Tax=Methanomassiliicoccus luminyensis TaxID=1080712 RepID=UPI000474BC7F|nr:hypothetical protein [Methanomassiliicoccus luminyensis]
MNRSLAAMLVLCMLLASSTLAAVPSASAWVLEEPPPSIDYPGKYKMLCPFDFTDATEYGVGQEYDPHQLMSREYVTGIQMQGEAALRVSVDFGGTNKSAVYRWSVDPSLSPYAIDRVMLAYAGEPSLPFLGESTSHFFLSMVVRDKDHQIIRNITQMLAIDHHWHYLEFLNLARLGGSHYSLELWYIGGEELGGGRIYLDDLRAVAPPCDVKFSFFNQYTGIGLTGETLIPEVFHNGKWERVWNNEITIAAGEVIDYRVKDYFGQIISWVQGVKLDSTVKYIDIQVPLVKVQIAKPANYTMDYPPEWQVMALATGKAIQVQGWELELLAGQYRFGWGDMATTADQDEIIRNGTVEINVYGSDSLASSNAVIDLSHSMTTISRTADNDTSFQLRTEVSPLDEFIGTMAGAAEKIQGSQAFRVLLALAMVGSVLGYLRMVSRGVAKKADDFLNKEEEAQKGRRR